MTKRRGKKKEAQNGADRPAMSEQALSEPATGVRLTTVQLLGLCGLIAVVYIVYSFFSDGYYQHDEAAHFLSMRRFWFEPNIILSNWSKPGFKLITAPVSLLGPQALVVFNSLVAAASCYLAYRLAEAVDARIPLVAVLLLCLQPLWLQLSFRNYSEPITALILVGAVLAHYRDRDWLAALLLSYTAMIRQEMYPLIALFGLWLLVRRDFRAVALLAVFPLVHNVWGWAATGDPNFVVNNVLGFSGTAQDAYPRQGFLHYPTMSLTIFGGLSLTFLFAYVAQGVARKVKWHWFILIPVLAYVGMHVVFSIQSFKVGPSTGGNLRYLIVVAPLVAVLGALAAGRLAEMRSFKDRKPEIFAAALLGVFTLLFLSQSHNNIVLTGERDLAPFLTVLMAGVLIAVPMTRRKLTAAVAVVAALSALLVVRPYQPSPEDGAVRAVVDWIQEYDIDEEPILMNHTMLYYFLGRIEQEMTPGSGRITEDSVREAEPGTIIIWDSHYSYRPSLADDHVPHTWFLERPEQFSVVGEPIMTQDRRFALFIFRKQASGG